jgi:hypothetical protein
VVWRAEGMGGLNNNIWDCGCRCRKLVAPRFFEKCISGNANTFCFTLQTYLLV